MAQRISEQVVEWLTVGGNGFTPHFVPSTAVSAVPLVVNKPGASATFPATNGTAIGIYNNQGQLWTLGAAGATTSVKSSQLIVSSSDAAAGAGAALELWRGTDVSWQLLASNSDDLLYIGNNWTTAAQTSYTANIALGYGAVANQYIHIYSILDSNYSYGGASGSALSVAGGITAAKKIYFSDTTDSNYATKAGALVVEGGVNIAKKVYLRDTTDSNYATVAGSLVTMGGVYIKKKTYIADVTDSNYATKAGSLVTEGGAYIAKKTYIASTTDSNYSTKAGSLVTEGGIYSAKKVYIADATDSNYSTLAGALVVAGGANFGKKVYLKDTTDSTSYTTGSLVTAGGAAITKQLRVQGVTTHGGNVLSDTNDTDDIGATATRWKNGYFSNVINVGAASTTYSTTDNKNTYIQGGAITVNANTNSSTGYYLYGKGTSYGRWYVDVLGTANTPAAEEGGTGTAGTQGWTQLILGNSTAVNTNTAYGSSSSGANNASGQLTLYGFNTKYGAIRSSGTSTGNHIYYLPRLYTSTSTYYGKLVGIVKSSSTTSVGDSNFSDVGSARIPVYVTADGKVAAGDITFDTLNANRLMWTSAANKPYAGYHYANSTKVAINSSSEPTRNFYVSGNAEISGAGAANTALLNLNTTRTPTAGQFDWGVNHLVANMIANSNTSGIVTGKAASAGNSAYFGFHYEASDSASNYVSIGMYGYNHLLTVNKQGVVTAGGFARPNGTASTHVISPSGGSYTTRTSTVTGAIKITLPVSWTNTMMTFVVEIFDYSNNSRNTYYISGYNYSTTPAWANCNAYSIGSGNKQNLKVRWGHDGTKCCVTIGETNTSWSYPQVTIRDFYGGYSSPTNTQDWSSGWSISFVTTLPSTVNITLPAYGGSQIYAGNNVATIESQIGVIHNAGKLYLYSTNTNTGGRGIYTFNNAGTGAYVFSLNQSNFIDQLATIAVDINLRGPDTSNQRRLYSYKNDGTAWGFFGPSMNGSHWGVYYSPSSTYAIDINTSNNITFNGHDLNLKGSCTASVAIDSAGPYVEFANANRDQYCRLVYSDYDSWQAPDSLTLIGNQVNTTLVVPRLRINRSGDGFGWGSSAPSNTGAKAGMIYFKTV